MKNKLIDLVIALQTAILRKFSKRYAAGYSYAMRKFMESPTLNTLNELEAETSIEHTFENWSYSLGMLDFMEEKYDEFVKDIKLLYPRTLISSSERTLN